MTSPALIFDPSWIFTIAPGGNVYTIGVSVPENKTGFPLPFTREALGLTVVVDPVFFESIIMMLVKPVILSTCSATVTPSMKSSNFIVPDASVIIG